MWYNEITYRCEVKKLIQSLIKASMILEYLRSEKHEFTIAEIAESVDLPPSTAHRILSTLIHCGYVAKDERTHLYTLGPGLIPLGIAATANINPQRTAYDVLKELTKLTGEDSFLIIKSGDKGMVISKVEGNHTLKIVENFGLEIDLHWGAIRKVILAYQSPEYIDEYINKGLSNYLNGTVDEDKLRKELAQIRNTGISTSNSEYITNATGIGAPVFNYNNELLGAIGIVAPTERILSENKETAIHAVKTCAEKLSRKLGWSR